jgi:hypothetical protein
MRTRLFAAAAMAAVLAVARPGADAQDAPSPRAAHLAFLRAVHRTLGPRATKRVLESLHAEAKAATALHVRWRAHLSGRIVTSRFVVEPGAEVTIEPGTVIYVAGDMTIAAPITMTPPAARRAKAETGTAGANVEDAAILCAGDGTIESELIGAAGGAGQDVSVFKAGRGGAGGKGGGFAIACQGPLTISGTIAPGRGGKGGNALVAGEAGTDFAIDGGSASAEAGDGGDAGDVKIAAPSVAFTNPGGSIDLADGGAGGNALATGGGGQPSEARGGNGGNATAKGGDAGKGTSASVRLLGKGGTVTGQARTMMSSSLGAPGGGANALEGDGASALGRFPNGCPGKGLAGGPGGRSGSATATGGKGAQAPILTVKGGPATPASEGLPGKGGNANAGFDGMSAGNGGVGQAAKQPGRGGNGGDSGKVRATGGAGGGAKTVTGGAGGDASASEPLAGNGGNGGDCCDNPGGRGAAGGDVGRVGRGQVVAGKGGRGAPDGPDGNVDFHDAGPSVSGARGADCPGGGGTGGGVTYAGPLTEIRIYSSGGDTGTWYIDADVYNPTAAPVSVEVRMTVDGAPFGVPVAETVNVPAKSGATNGHSFVGRAGPLTKGHHKARLLIDGQVAAVVEFDVD